MADRTLLVYSLADLGITSSNYNFSTIATGGTFTAAATAAPSVVTVTDNDSQDNVFNDGLPGSFASAPQQFLTGTIDGVTYNNTPTNPENRFEVFDSSGASVGFIHDLHNANSADFSSLQGYVTTFPLIPGETYTVGTPDGLGDASYSTFLVCFAEGSRITTARGQVVVEELREGDLVQTRDSGLQPIRWIGRRSVPGQGKFAPVTFRKGVLGNSRDLRVSPLHRMLLTGWQAEMLFGEAEVLACAKHLVNGDTIFSEPCGEITYFHILFDRHEIILAEDCPSESFFPGPATIGSVEYEVREELFALFPELKSNPEHYGPTARRCLGGKEEGLLSQSFPRAHMLKTCSSA